MAGRRGVGAAPQLVRDRRRRPRRARTRRGAQPAAAELPGARAAPHPRHRAHEVAVHAGRVPRLRPRRARSRPRTSRSTRCDGHVVVRGAGDFWQHVLGRAPAHLEPSTRSRRALRGDLHVGHGGHAEGRDAHRAHHELQRAVGVRGQRARPTHDVVWVPSPIGHSTGLNFGVRLALYFGMKLVLQDRWDADRAVELIERERCSYTLAATTFLTDLVAAAQRSDRDVSSLTRFGCGGAPVPPEIVRAGADAGHQRAAHLRAHRGARRELEPRRLAARASACTPTGWRCPRWSSTIRDGEVMVRGPNVCVGLFDDPERERSHLHRRRLAAHRRRRRARRRRLPLDRRAQEGDHHPRRPQHRAARDRGPVVRDARRARGGGDRPARRAPRRDHVRVLVVDDDVGEPEPDLDAVVDVPPVPRSRDLQAAAAWCGSCPSCRPRRRARSARTSSAS